MAVLDAHIRLGFSADTGASSLVGQGHRTPEDLEQQLTPEEVVGSCKSLHSPGGDDANPVALLYTGGQFPPRPALFVPDPGETVLAVAEKSLEQAIHFVRHCLLASCPCVPRMIALPNVPCLVWLEADKTSDAEPDSSDFSETA